MDPPGFERVEDKGKRPYYNLRPVTNVNVRRKFTSASQLGDYLEDQHSRGLSLNINVKDFNFRKRKLCQEIGICSEKRRKIKNNESEEIKSNTGKETDEMSIEEVSDKGAPGELKSHTIQEETVGTKTGLFQSNNLLFGHSKIDHKTELEIAAAKLDSYRRTCNSDTIVSNTEFSEEIKSAVLAEKSLENVVEVLCLHKGAFGQMCKVIRDKSLQEMLALTEIDGPLPLSDFPNDVTKNWFSEVTKFAIQHSPVTTAMLANLIIKEHRHNVEPSHVLQFATSFAYLARCVNKRNNAHEKMTTLLLKMGGLTDNAVNALAKQNNCVTATSLRFYRDYFAEAAAWVMERDSMNMPSQFAIDNCDLKGEHLTVEYIETETVDTRNLCTEPMAPDEIKNLFRPEMVMLGAEEHLEEKQHLDDVIGIAVGREIGKLRPEQASILLRHLPEHHKHKHSNIPIVAAKINLVSPHYYMETSNSEMICLAEELQSKKLWALASQKPEDEQFRRDLAHIYQIVPGNESADDRYSREMAEYRVEKTVQEAGDLIGHGDLLTVKMFQRALLLRSGSVRAVDRLVYLGAFRLQLFHLVMNKIALDIQTGMPNEKNRVDEGSLGQVVGAMGVSGWFSNKKKKIVRGNNYEKHSQVVTAYQLGLLGNMFDNFNKKNPIALNLVKDKTSAVHFVKKMMEEYGVFYYWDPAFIDPMVSIKCDLFQSCRDQVIRLVLNLGFRQCEKNNDSTGLRALRRVMCPYFLNKSPQQTSNYAKFIFTDLVVEESSSERSRERMDLLVTVNPSGTQGGGLYRDMYNEVMVRLVKEAIKNQHSSLNHIQIETLVQSISVMTALHDHNMKSRLQESSSHSSSNDMVGDENRQLIAELIQEVDPFNTRKDDKSDWSVKVRSSPFEGLDYANVLRFVKRVQEQFSLQFPSLG